MAAKLGITAESLLTWVREDEAPTASDDCGASVSVVEEMARLRAEDAKLLRAGSNNVSVIETTTNTVTGSPVTVGTTPVVAAVTAVPKRVSSTTVVSAPNPPAVGQLVTFTASVSGDSGTPTGTVMFKEGATVLGSDTLDGSGQATFTTSALAAGSHTITAEYKRRHRLQPLQRHRGPDGCRGDVCRQPDRAGTAGYNVINGNAGSYAILGTAGAGAVFAGAGNDAVNGAGGNDLICGGTSNDTLAGAAGADRIEGGTGNDVLSGGDGNDTLSGGGNDTLNGNAGTNTNNGGTGFNACTSPGQARATNCQA
ncbi:Ig-like domain repeat protein [Streptomyces sp. NRRL F-2664]|uniref:Ig-like domain repeat protein n=1 Tax=Streptomyces sp. NRRL F-2664 TaxID=1463842 RepID=UPI0004CAE04A|nr:Ig-like domain repeat protein [Streptomyces sp. NRRL F-2664]